jgi:nucleoside-diphosphate-sugar epimerase
VESALVTGGSGFVGGHLVALLLEEGYTVRTTVRSLSNPAKIGHLLDLQRRHAGRLSLFEADLLAEGAFDEAMAACDWVFHVASPFLMPEQIRDGQKEVVEPALRGTRNVLGAVERTPSVRRVVLTSTVGAIFGDYSDVLAMEGQVLSERYFNESSTVDYNPYHYSKVQAEKLAWALCAEQSRWDLVCINPGLVLGPSLSTASDSGSLFLLDEILGGKLFFGVPDISVATVDVREVAAAHLAAARTPGAHGRYIIAEREMAHFLDLARLLRESHRRPWLLPRGVIPGWLLRLLGPLFGLSRKYQDNHVGIRFSVDNRRSIEELGLRYRPLRETLADHYRSWQAARDAAA